MYSDPKLMGLKVEEKPAPVEWYWHIHHQQLIEPAYESIEERREYIRRRKPLHERELRLKWMTKVSAGRLPIAYRVASEALTRAWRKKNEYREARSHGYGYAMQMPPDWYGISRDVDEKAEVLRAVMESPKVLSTLNSIHRIEHGTQCPWNGEEMVFPEYIMDYKEY